MKTIVKSILTLALAALIIISMSAVPFTAGGTGPKIKQSPQNYRFPEGSDAVYSVSADGSDVLYTWYIRFKAVDYPVMASMETSGAEVYDNFTSAELVPVTGGSKMILHGIKKGLDGAYIYCIASNSNGADVSQLAYITVYTPGSGDNLSPAEFTILDRIVITNDKILKLSCRVDYESGFDYEYQWYQSSSPSLYGIMALIGENESVLVVDPAFADSYYVCMVTKKNSSQSNFSYSALCHVTWEDPGEDSDVFYEASILSGPSNTEFKIGDNIIFEGLNVRLTSGKGFMDIIGKDMLVFPKNAYSTELQFVVAKYEDCPVKVPITVKSENNFGIYATTGQILTLENPEDSVTFGVASLYANSEVFYKWYVSDETYSARTTEIGSADSITIGGLKSSDNGKYYYLCVAECDGKEATAEFQLEVKLPEETTEVPEETTPDPAGEATGGPATEPTSEPTAEPGGNSGGKRKLVINKGPAIALACGLVAVAAVLVVVMVKVGKKKH